ncbi:kinase-like domain-containing protein [Penicillium chrysogenum]|nr:kinase-like domain-containing protein [Penicillium chrysogenum]
MTERLQESLESVFKIFGFFNPERRYETSHDKGVDYTLMAQNATDSDPELEASGIMFPSSTNTTRNRSSGNGTFALENGKHCHFQKPPTFRKRLFEKNTKTRNTKWVCFKRKTTVARRDFSSRPRADLEWERWIKSPSQTGVTAYENMALLSQKYGKIYDTIGRGSSGIILVSHKVQEWHPNIECLYAIKVFRRGTQTSETETAYRRRVGAEFSISSSLRHQNVIRTFDLLPIGNDSLCECLEYCSGGDLHSLVVAKGQLEKAEADCFFKQLMHGANYIHEMGIAHRDLKPENLLVTSHGCLKISDFGDAECFRLAWENDIHMSRTRRGSRPYVSPEQYLEKEFDPRKVDIWAAAVTYVAMRTGKIPWNTATNDDESFRDYIEDRRIGRGCFLIDDICYVMLSYILVLLGRVLIS